MLEDDIWCKLIVMEKNCRVGKAYARVPMITINGSAKLSFDGEKLAINGFENIERSAESIECRKKVGRGVKIKMDSSGNILVNRLSKAKVFVRPLPDYNSAGNENDNDSDFYERPSRQLLVKRQRELFLARQKLEAQKRGDAISSSSSASTSSTNDSGDKIIQSNDSKHNSAIGDRILEQENGELKYNQIEVLFDMTKFQANISRELENYSPSMSSSSSANQNSKLNNKRGKQQIDIKKLQRQCFTIIALVSNTSSNNLFELPIWLIVINIVAVQMLHEQLPKQITKLPLQLKSLPSPKKSTSNKKMIRQQQPKFLSVFDQQQENQDDDLRELRYHHHHHHHLGIQGTKVPSNNNRKKERLSQQQNIDSSTSNNLSSTTSSSFDASASGLAKLEAASAKRRLARRHAGGNLRRPIGNQLEHRHKPRLNESIYSPGHQLMAQVRRGGLSSRPLITNSASAMIKTTSADTDRQVPPKLPPRDFAGRQNITRAQRENLGIIASNNYLGIQQQQQQQSRDIQPVIEESNQKQDIEDDKSSEVKTKTKRRFFQFGSSSKKASINNTNDTNIVKRKSRSIFKFAFGRNKDKQEDEKLRESDITNQQQITKSSCQIPTPDYESTIRGDIYDSDSLLTDYNRKYNPNNNSNNNMMMMNNYHQNYNIHQDQYNNDDEVYQQHSNYNHHNNMRLISGIGFNFNFDNSDNDKMMLTDANKLKSGNKSKSKIRAVNESSNYNMMQVGNTSALDLTSCNKQQQDYDTNISSSGIYAANNSDSTHYSNLNNSSCDDEYCMTVVTSSPATDTMSPKSSNWTKVNNYKQRLKMSSSSGYLNAILRGDTNKALSRLPVSSDVKNSNETNIIRQLVGANSAHDLQQKINRRPNVYRFQNEEDNDDVGTNRHHKHIYKESQQNYNVKYQQQQQHYGKHKIPVMMSGQSKMMTTNRKQLEQSTGALSSGQNSASNYSDTSQDSIGIGSCEIYEQLRMNRLASDR